MFKKNKQENSSLLPILKQVLGCPVGSRINHRAALEPMCLPTMEENLLIENKPSHTGLSLQQSAHSLIGDSQTI